MVEELSEWTRRYVTDPPLPFPSEEQHHKPMSNEDSISNKFVSPKHYSGPRTEDIAYPLAMVEPQTQPVQEISTPTVPPLERSTLSKVDKYTLKVKNDSNGMCNDGYKWRKYGQKTIKNRPNPRSYYKCTNQVCNAKKQVEKSNDEPNTYIVTYEGFHFHHSDPFFLPYETTQWPNKKQKTQKHNTEDEPYLEINKEPQTKERNKQAQVTEPAYQNHQAHEAQINIPANLEDELLFPVDQCWRSQGLLEDVVAPAIKTTPVRDSVLAASWSSCSSSSSRASSPPLSPSSFCWSPNSNIRFSDEILELIGVHKF